MRARIPQVTCRAMWGADWNAMKQRVAAIGTANIIAYQRSLQPAYHLRFSLGWWYRLVVHDASVVCLLSVFHLAPGGHREGLVSFTGLHCPVRLGRQLSSVLRCWRSRAGDPVGIHLSLISRVVVPFRSGNFQGMCSPTAITICLWSCRFSWVPGWGSGQLLQEFFQEFFLEFFQVVPLDVFELEGVDPLVAFVRRVSRDPGDDNHDGWYGHQSHYACAPHRLGLQFVPMALKFLVTAWRPLVVFPAPSTPA